MAISTLTFDIESGLFALLFFIFLEPKIRWLGQCKKHIFRLDTRVISAKILYPAAAASDFPIRYDFCAWHCHINLLENNIRFDAIDIRARNARFSIQLTTRRPEGVISPTHVPLSHWYSKYATRSKKVKRAI